MNQKEQTLLHRINLINPDCLFPLSLVWSFTQIIEESAHHRGSKHHHHHHKSDGTPITAISHPLIIHRVLLSLHHRRSANKTAKLVRFALFLEEYPHSAPPPGGKRHVQQRLDVDMDVSPRSVECQERESPLVHRRRADRSALIIADCSGTDHVVRSIGVDVGG